MKLTAAIVIGFSVGVVKSTSSFLTLRVMFGGRNILQRARQGALQQETQNYQRMKKTKKKC